VHVAVREALRDLGVGAVVLVACSGGPDSLALAAATANLALRHGWAAGAVVVDHGWSEASSAASEQAAQTCRKLGLDPVELVRVDCTGPGGPEAAARTARYRALADAADRLDADAVLLGHTLDDQAETVLLGLGRGSGARSLAGMSARRGVYRRPLLGQSRAVTLAACAGMGLQPWLDPANDDPAYARVRVRRLAAELRTALGPGVAEALARTADLLRDDADALDAAATELLQQARPQQPGQQQAEPQQAGPERLDDLDAATLAAAPNAIRRRSLLAAARSAGSPPGALGHRHALALDHLLNAQPGAGADLPGGVRARVVRVDGVRRVRFERSSGYGKLGPVAGS
jgi:tRNA(Ile)-lysidine synthetase-like protein